MRRISVFAIIIALVISCQPRKADYRETPTPTGSEYCGLAEQHLMTMCRANPEDNLYCCQAVSSTKKGKNFTQFCEETQNAGIALNPECISKIVSCGDIDKCLGTSR